jgi:hypothetical protein
MDRWHRWGGLYVCAVVATVLAYAVAYNVGMATVENDPQSFLHSLEVVLVHFATVGYATEWPTSGAMTTLVAVISVTGQVVVPVSLLAAAALGIRELSSSMVRS